MPSRRTLVALAALTLAGPVLTPAWQGAASPPPALMCDDKPVTITGWPDTDLVGTPGPDVILTNDADRVLAGAGADTICVDTMDGTTRPAGQYYNIDVGDADDIAMGTEPSNDVVLSVADPNAHGEVISGAVGMVDDNADEILLEGGPAAVTSYGTPSGSIVVETGRTPARLVLGRGGSGAWDVDNVSGTLTVAGREPTALRGFDAFEMGAADWSSLRFRGAQARESLLLDASRDLSRRIDVRMNGASNDVDLRAGQRGRVVGGSGSRNQVTLIRGGSGRPGGRVDAVIQGRSVHLTRHRATKVTGFDRVGLEDFLTTFVRVRGPHSDHVAILGCRATISLGDGADRLLFGVSRRCFGGGSAGDVGLIAHAGPGRDHVQTAVETPATSEDRLYGGKGNDVLAADRGNDLLVGGLGRDRADGGRGNDRCQAEVRSNCDH